MKHGTKDSRLRKLIARFRAGFLQERTNKLFDALSMVAVARAVGEEVKDWRERVFALLVTLRLFVEQMLHADHACQDVVMRYAGEREQLGRKRDQFEYGVLLQGNSGCRWDL